MPSSAMARSHAHLGVPGTHRTPRTATAHRARSDRGVSLLETLVAVTILLVVLAGLIPLAGNAIATTEGQDQVARTVEYAQDKMEQLLSLPFGDTTTNTAVFPSNAVGGSGLTVGGSTDPAAPVAGYVDYLDGNGAYLAFTGTTPPSGWAYCRVWQVTSPSANLKQIRVTVRMFQSGLLRPLPQSTLVTLKSSPF
jgi:prepilin-type N-terminal cleavage/methylation domain-containing protein